eukprot:PhF_6_TR4216/c0_g1_i2/m.5680
MALSPRDMRIILVEEMMKRCEVSVEEKRCRENILQDARHSWMSTKRCIEYHVSPRRQIAMLDPPLVDLDPPFVDLDPPFVDLSNIKLCEDRSSVGSDAIASELTELDVVLRPPHEPEFIVLSVPPHQTYESSWVWTGSPMKAYSESPVPPPPIPKESKTSDHATNTESSASRCIHPHHDPIRPQIKIVLQEPSRTASRETNICDRETAADDTPVFRIGVLMSNNLRVSYSDGTSSLVAGDRVISIRGCRIGSLDNLQEMVKTFREGFYDCKVLRQGMKKVITLYVRPPLPPRKAKVPIIRSTKTKGVQYSSSGLNAVAETVIHIDDENDSVL